MKILAITVGVFVVGNLWALPSQDKSAVPATISTGAPGCPAVPAQEGANLPEGGRVEENVYTNDFYGLRYEFPKGWHVDEEMIRDAAHQKSHMAHKDRGDYAYRSWLSAQCDHLLLEVSRDPEKGPPWSEANLWETPRISLRIKDREVGFAEGSNVRWSTYVFDGQVFTRMDWNKNASANQSQETAKASLTRILYTAALTGKRNGRSIVFRISAESLEQRKDLIETLHSLHFN